MLANETMSSDDFEKEKKTDTNIDCQSCENAIFPDPTFQIEINLIERVNLVSSE